MAMEGRGTPCPQCRRGNPPEDRFCGACGAWFCGRRTDRPPTAEQPDHGAERVKDSYGRRLRARDGAPPIGPVRPPTARRRAVGRARAALPEEGARQEGRFAHAAPAAVGRALWRSSSCWAARAPGAGRLRRLQVLRGAARAPTPGAVAPLEGRTAEDGPFPMAGYDEELLADRSTANHPPRTCR